MYYIYVMDEKRKNPRFKINQLIAYTPEGDQFHRAEALDISSGGVKCASAQAVEPMTSVFLLLKLPSAQGKGEREVACEGYVSHARMVDGRCVFGIRFTSVAPEGKSDFDAFIATLEKEESPLP
jgi:c-di-GMP-binding flagellar brake protein YcgR